MASLPVFMILFFTSFIAALCILSSLDCLVIMGEKKITITNHPSPWFLAMHHPYHTSLLLENLSKSFIKRGVYFLGFI